MKSIKIRGLLFIFSLFIFTSCQKEDGNSGGEQQENIPDTFSEYFGNEISRDFLGTVIDKNNLPIEGVTITIGNKTALTDSNGVFIIRDANVNERFGYIKAEKAGYIQGSRSVVPSEGVNKVDIMLLAANVTATITSGSSETVTLDNGSSVSFDGNFVKEDDSEYSGSVDVILHHLDPADDDMAAQMPGMLYAENTEGAERMLQTLGMLAVELRSNSGEELNLAEGSTSEIKIPVDASLMSIAPATIPLWYFDETKGYWKEEGEATLQGNMYVGTVSHFSFWNCDIQVQANILTVHVINEEGIPLNNVNVEITSSNLGMTNNYTNENGQASGLIPSNELLQIDVYNYEVCEIGSLNTQTVGPFTSDSSISITILDNVNVVVEKITGLFITCSDSNVEDGYIQLSYGNQTFTNIVNNGNFEFNLLSCDSEKSFKLEGFDYQNLQTTGKINYSFSTPITQVGMMKACNDINEFIQYTIDGSESVFITSPISANFNAIDNSSNNNNPRLYIYAVDTHPFNLTGKIDSNNSTGIYDDLDWNITNDTGFNIYDFYEVITISYYDINNNTRYSLNSLGEIGEYIDLNISGTYDDDDGVTHTISGTIHVLRDN